MINKVDIIKMVYGNGLDLTKQQLKQQLQKIQPSREVSISQQGNNLIVDLIR